MDYTYDQQVMMNQWYAWIQNALPNLNPMTSAYMTNFANWIKMNFQIDPNYKMPENTPFDFQRMFQTLQGIPDFSNSPFKDMQGVMKKIIPTLNIPITPPISGVTSGVTIKLPTQQPTVPISTFTHGRLEPGEIPLDTSKLRKNFYIRNPRRK